MSDVNRVSSSEQARNDAIKSSQKKVKVKNAETGATQKGSAQYGKIQGDKKLKSSFDDVLESLTESTMPVMPQESKFDSRLKEIQRDDDYSQSDSDEGDDDTKTKDKSDSKETHREGVTGVKGRVAGKRQSGEQGRGGSGGDKDSKGGEDGQAKAQQMPHMKKRAMAPQVGPAPTSAFGIQTTASVQAAESAAPRELPKAVLDQIIQSVTIMKDKDLNTEMSIEFHDNFFNGLKLKVRKKDNEISIEFFAPNQSVAATFRNERDKIATAMGEKGIDVRDIEVKLS